MGEANALSAGEEEEEVVGVADETTPDEPVVPRAYEWSRYMALGERSPFMLDATPTQTVAESPFRDLALAGISEIGGKKRIILINLKTKEYQRIVFDPDDPANNTPGSQVIQIHHHPDPKQAKVEIEMNGERGTIAFDQSLIGSQLSGPQQAPQVRPPGAPGQARPQVPAALSSQASKAKPGSTSSRRRIVLPKSITRPTTPATGQGAPVKAKPPKPKANG